MRRDQGDRGEVHAGGHSKASIILQPLRGLLPRVMRLLYRLRGVGQAYRAPERTAMVAAAAGGRSTMTNRQLWQEHLALAERPVTEAEHHVNRQRQVIADLERHGHDTESARYLLSQFEEMLAIQVADRDRLRGDLGE
jgi:hypothetical protein